MAWRQLHWTQNTKTKLQMTSGGETSSNKIKKKLQEWQIRSRRNCKSDSQNSICTKSGQRTIELASMMIHSWISIESESVDTGRISKIHRHKYSTKCNSVAVHCLYKAFAHNQEGKISFHSLGTPNPYKLLLRFYRHSRAYVLWKLCQKVKYNASDVIWSYFGLSILIHVLSYK